MRRAEGGMDGPASITHSTFRIPHSKEGILILIRPRDLVAMPAPRLVRLPASHHDRRAFPEGRPSVHETLVAARRAAAHHADSLELVDDLGDREQRGHRAE